MILNNWYCSGVPHCSNEDPLCWCPEHVRIARESEGPMRPRRRVAIAMLEPPLPDRSGHHPHEPERRRSGAGGPKWEGAAPPLISFMLSSSLVISKNTIVLFGEITTERTFSRFSFLKAVIGLFLKVTGFLFSKHSSTSRWKNQD